MRSVLLIAYHFPPVSVSSGLQRTLSLVRYLPAQHWQPLVLSVHPRVYESTNDGQTVDIPAGTTVKRAFALDTRKHLSIRGRYLRFMALPDRWVSWTMGGVIAGLRMIRKYRPAVIWTTYPIATAHLIGWILHRVTGLPWVADFRDSMTEEQYPESPVKRKVYRWIERRTVSCCSVAVFTTQGSLQMYSERYPDLPAERWAVIPNGYDEEIFAEVEGGLRKPDVSAQPVPRILLHSGVIYPSERDPSAFFQALAELKRTGLVDSRRLKVCLRGCGREDLFRPLLQKYDIDDLVELLPVIPYREALAEILTADALLVMQASNCNHQVPAKVYEYFRAGRPVLGLTDPEGETARVMADAGLRDIIPLDDANAIVTGLLEFLRKVEAGAAETATPAAVGSACRKHAAARFAQIFDGVQVRPTG
jgi:glycosyltransferase involved in cell wall biosynthesis